MRGNLYLIFLSVTLVVFTNSSRGQSFAWWADNVGWDGISHWSRYIITQPGFMGPNALPVPRMSNGRVDSNFSVGISANFHFAKGDQTINPLITLNYCLVKDLISFDLAWVPYEYFTMDHAIKTKRHVFSHWYHHHEAKGNIHLNTNVQLTKTTSKTDLALRLGYTFPTASGLGMARYTDAPVYFFDLSMGKPISRSLKWTAMLGFYSWQIISDSHRQNDALLFGTGIELNKPSFILRSHIAGYLGYLEKEDKPVVIRLNAEKRLSRLSLVAGFQQGIHHFDFSSFELGAKYMMKTAYRRK